MAEQIELEQRLHRLGEAYDDVVPKTPGLEMRLMARISTTTGEEPAKPSLRRELALAGALLIFVVLLAVGLTNLRMLRQPAQPATPTRPTPAASISATPLSEIPADDLAAAGLTPALITPIDTEATDQGNTARLLGGYADPARIVVILHLAGPAADASTVIRAQVRIDDAVGMINASSSSRSIPSTGDLIFMLDGGPHPGPDGLAHLAVAITNYAPGNGPGVVDGRWNFSIALPIHSATQLPAPPQFSLGRWTGSIEIFELTPTVLHLQLVINGASVPEIGLTTVTFLDPAGNVIGQGCGAGITVSKTQISGPNSPLYRNARVYCEFSRPSAAGLYQIRFQGGGGTYVIPVSIASPTASPASR